MEYRYKKLSQYIRGWMNYFGISEYYRPIPEVDHAFGVTKAQNAHVLLETVETSSYQNQEPPQTGDLPENSH